MLIKVLRTGICGTDVHIYNWDAWAQKTIPVPMVVGHEFVGEIVEVGSNVTDFHPGEIVSGEGHVVCGRCRNCLAGRRHLCKDTKGVGVNRPGAFAEYLCAADDQRLASRSGASRATSQAIFDPFGNAVHTALSFDVLGEDVLITGAGPIGIMAAAVVRHAGARHVVITDVNPYRLELARKMGATLAVDVRERPHRRRAEAAGHEGRLRRRPGDVRQPATPSATCSPTCATAARSPCSASPTQRDRHRLEHGRLQHAHDQGHLRPRDVRDLVQDDRHAPSRPGHQPGHHPPLSLQRVREGLRRDAVRASRGKVILTWHEG